MSVAWSAYPFKRALQAKVAARSGITSLTPVPSVVTYYPSPDDRLSDTVIIGFNLVDSKEKVTLGGQTHDETVDVTCQVRVVRPGGGEDVAQDVEDRAKAILAEVDAQLRDQADPVTVAGAQIINPAVVSRESLLFSRRAQDGTATKMCVIEFVVRYRAKTRP